MYAEFCFPFIYLYRFISVRICYIFSTEFKAKRFSKFGKTQLNLEREIRSNFKMLKKTIDHTLKQD